MNRIRWLDANGITAACAVVALVIAAFQITSSNRNARHIEAAAAYREYLSLAIEYPNIANGVQAGQVPSAKYEWFVSYLLNSAEQIATSSAYDREWEQTLLAQFCLHRAYLRSARFKPQRKHYAANVRALLDQLPERCDKARNN